MFFPQISLFVFLAFSSSMYYANNPIIFASHNNNSSLVENITFDDDNIAAIKAGIVGSWTSVDGKVRVSINDQGRVTQPGLPSGTTIVPCCGNFGFRRPNDSAVYKYDNCIYWVYFSKDGNTSGWYKLPDFKTNSCPIGVFRREKGRR